MYGFLLLLAALLPASAALAGLAWACRGRASRAREASEARFGDLVEHLPGFAYRCRDAPDWQLEFCSEPVAELTGYSAAELVEGERIHLGDLIHPDDRDRVWHDVQQAVRAGRPFELRYRLCTRSGEERWVWEHGRGLSSPSGAVVAIEGFVMDVTAEHRLAEERERLIHALEGERARLDAVIERLPVGILLASADGRVEGANTELERVLRHPFRPSTTAKEYARFGAYTPNGRRLELQEWPLARALRGEKVSGEDYLYQRGDGTRGWVRVSGAPLVSRGGDIEGAVIALFDVDREKRAELALRESESRFRNMADNAPVILWVTDPSGDTVYLNRPWYEFTGQAHGEALGFGWLAAVHAEDRAATRAGFLAANARREAFRSEYRLRRKGGEHRWVIDTASPRFSADDEFLGYIGSITDITERKQVEEERERLLRQAEEAIRVRDDFLAIASHELKTPIASLTLQTGGLARIARRGTLPSPERLIERLEVMERQAQRLTVLVNDLLDVSRVARGRLHVEPEREDLAALVRDVTARWGPSFARARSLVHVEAPPRLMALFDVKRMEQVLENLLSNAIKYGAGRPIEVKLAPVQDRACLTVRDHGIGVAPEDQARIFERFERAVASKHYGGLGLGLWITRQLVEAMDGWIDVESAPGQGAAFHVWLPCEEATAPSLEARPGAST